MALVQANKVTWLDLPTVNRSTESMGCLKLVQQIQCKMDCRKIVAPFWRFIRLEGINFVDLLRLYYLDRNCHLGNICIENEHGCIAVPFDKEVNGISLNPETIKFNSKNRFLIHDWWWMRRRVTRRLFRIQSARQLVHYIHNKNNFKNAN